MSNNRYMVLAKDNLLDLEEQVNDWLDRGWQLQGGIGVSNKKSGEVKYLQAMFKEKKEK